MSTINQIEANRQNAKKSTGPRSKAGKAKVSLNALKHGLLAKTARLPDEDEETFRIFADDLLTDLQPVGAVESLLAEEIINLAWRLRRASLVEAGLFVREQAIADEEWFRQQESDLELTEKEAWPRRFAISRGFTHPDDVIDILDEDLHTEMGRLATEAVGRRRSDLGRLGDAFARDAAGGNAFSKIGRYETAIDRRLSRKLDELRILQEARSGEVQA